MVRLIVEVLTVRKCPGCDRIVEDGEEEPLYECNSCGEGPYCRAGSADGDSNRCPGCNKFGARTGDEGCPDGCGEPLEDAYAVENDDGVQVVVEGELVSGPEVNP